MHTTDIHQVTAKKVVHYTGDITFFGEGQERRAFLVPVDHPSVGFVENGEPARTSRVVEWDEATGRLVTERTIYVPLSVKAAA
jgi:hypothetical protein